MKLTAIALLIFSSCNAGALQGSLFRPRVVIPLPNKPSNLALAVAGALLMLTGLATDLLRIFVVINVFLAVFNMVPVPPLDGGNVLSGMIGGAAADALDRLRPYGFLILYALMFTGLLFSIVDPPAEFLLRLLL